MRACKLSKMVAGGWRRPQYPFLCVFVMNMRKIELYCLYIVDPGYPATWYLVILLLSFLKFSRPFIFMMIFLAVRSMLGEQGCIFLADFFSFCVQGVRCRWYRAPLQNFSGRWLVWQLRPLSWVCYFCLFAGVSANCPLFFNKILIIWFCQIKYLLYAMEISHVVGIFRCFL